MENKAHAMLAGTFVLLVSALLALLALWLTRDVTQRDIYEMSTSETLTGLQPQASVNYRGVPVGKVEAIGFDSKVKGNVLLRVSIDRAAPMTASTFASVVSQGVTGLSFIQLDDNGESTERLQPDSNNPPRIRLEVGGINKLVKKTEDILTQLEEASMRANTLLSGQNQQAITAAITQIGNAAGSIDALAKSLAPTVASLPKVSREAQATLLSVRTASDELAVTASRLNEKDGPLDKLSQSATALASGVETFSASTLPKLGNVADDTGRAMRQLRRTIDNVGDNPQALIFGNGPALAGPGEPGFSANSPANQ
ncbi:Chromosome partition protein Smc [Polaromonas vacuolata]|uniref:Chromosome partition protein Smc n=1 Tax=Polaromonas vacuolata TaxID=37448 RepID=A0A6H2H4U9_9BURK|nr:MlaD family protein [Polaromonas vacuolata]QJC54878.1 Chromosome partition protein Smc [Polaromonas vacuolata]